MRASRVARLGKLGLTVSLSTVMLLSWGWLARGQRADTARTTAGQEDLFSSTNIPHLRIEVTAKSIERLRNRGWSRGWGQGGIERPEVMATVREGERVYTNVALHLKGSAGSFQPVDAKPGLTLNFDKFVKGQTFHGLEKISLNNSVQDPSYLCEKTCRELFNRAGVPAPRADYATVELNGRTLGLYVLLEGYNRQFLKRHFAKSKGHLYDGGFLRDVDSPLGAGDGDGDTDDASTGLRRMVEAAQEPDLVTRFDALEQVLDIDRFITFLTMEVLVCHWDGYAMNKNNYRIYHDPETDRMVFMPHGMDQMFGVMMVQPNLGVRPRFQGLMAKALMETTEGRRRYFHRLTELNQSLLDVEALTNRIYQTAARLGPVLARLSASAGANHQHEVEDLCERISQRKLSLEEQLGGTQGKLIEFDTTGIAPLTDWKAVTQAGSPSVSQNSGPGGKTLLQIRATGHSVASWRTKVFLEEGEYRFEGRMKTSAIKADPRDGRAGAGLRISERSSRQKTLGDSNWQEVAFEFSLPDGLHDLELVCELRAAQGEVWFEADSLRLIRK